MLGALHFLVWLRDQKAWPSLVFSIVVIGVVGHALMELGFMTAVTAEVFGRYMRWSHFFGFVIIAGTVIFVRLYLRAGRWWLGFAVIGLRLVAMLMNFLVFDININYTEIRSLNFVTLLGQEVSIAGDADINRWMWLSQATFPLWFLFTVDATRSCLRQSVPGDRRGLVVGGAMITAILLGTSQAVLALNGWINLPLAPSLAFGFMTLAVGYELSRDVQRASRLANDLRASEWRLRLAAAAGRVVLWEWQVGEDKIWVSSGAREFFDLSEVENLRFEHFTKNLHPDDRYRVMQVIDQTIASGGAYAMEYRRIFSGNRVRWIAGSGTAERDPTSGSTLLRGVSVDVTESYESKESLRQQREQLSHTLRLATMNQMAASLAHELNQPLAAIVNNANAGRRMMDHGVFSQKEIVSILEDIVADGQRAGGVIRGIRAMARPDDQESTEFALGDVIDTLLPLIMVEARARNIEVKTEVEPALPRLWGNPVQVQQILINLAINALEASDSPSVGTRRVIIQAKAENKDGVFINVRDFGLGLPTESEDRLFEAFFTTKPAGLGMGLAIVKSLVEAHGGSVDATNAAGGGACFQVHLPIRPPP